MKKALKVIGWIILVLLTAAAVAWFGFLGKDETRYIKALLRDVMCVFGALINVWQGFVFGLYAFMYEHTKCRFIFQPTKRLRDV